MDFKHAGTLCQNSRQQQSQTTHEQCYSELADGQGPLLTPQAAGSSYGFMCGRYTLTVEEEQLKEAFDGDLTGNLRPRFNIAPSQNVPVVRMIEGKRKIDPLRWGLIPHWAKDVKIGYKMINARSEDAANKPSFRTPMRKQRCLVPCTGFFEWKVIGDPNATKPAKQPHYIRRRDSGLFALAGLWESWHSPEGETVESYTILTTTPNELIGTLHDRMPVILRPEDYAFWLDPNMQDATRLQPLFSPFPADDLVANPVSTRVNSPANDTPECIQEVA